MVDIKSYFIQLNMLRVKVDEYLARTFMRAGYAKADLIKTPLGTRVIIYADRPALIIGKKGQTIKQLTELFEKHFKIENPQITVTQVENPDLNARVVATRLALAIEKGYHFRRAAFVALRRVLGAGALGVEIVISGKLISERAKYEKIRAGKVYKTGGHVSYLVDRAVIHLPQKPGIYGIEVIIVLPREPSDRVEIVKGAPEALGEAQQGIQETQSGAVSSR